MKTATGQVISSVSQLRRAALELRQVPARREPSTFLMCEPTFFEVKDVKNPFMQAHQNGVDVQLAQRQWAELRAVYERLGCPVRTVRPVPGLEDMVFAANQVLPAVDEKDQPLVVLSNMVHTSRRAEVPYYRTWFEQQGYRVLRISENADHGPRFEGQGDAIWHPGKKLLWGGYGFRTEEAAYPRVAELLDIPVLKLKLVNPKFYHLDACFGILDERTVMIYRPAFDSASLSLIEELFTRILEVDTADANNFACNGVTLGRNVILQKGSSATCGKLKGMGFTPIEVDTSEFMKSGGSVFCMKIAVY
jgi:N-dimethylarginine dimethylaminohydrolase